LSTKLGDHIRELRLNHPIYKSLRQFAEKLGKSPSWVSKVERNIEKPGAETLTEIARLLGTSAEELFQLASQLEPDVEQNIAARYTEVSGLLRTLPFLTSDQILRLENQAKEWRGEGTNSEARDGDVIRMANAPTFLASRLDVPWTSDRDIEVAAYALRGAFLAAQRADGNEMSHPPVCPETLIFDFLDGRDRLTLTTDDALGLNEHGFPIAGQMKVADDPNEGGFIQIDCAIAATPLYPFTLAHEIGHWVLHRHHILRAREQMSLFDERPGQTHTLHRHLEGGKAKLPPEEWQANRFAVHLLLPADLVRDEFLSRYGQPLNYRDHCEIDAEFRNLYTQLRFYSREIARQPYFKKSSTGGEVVKPLHELFAVSCQAMAIRLEELQLVTDCPVQLGARLFNA